MMVMMQADKSVRGQHMGLPVALYGTEVMYREVVDKGGCVAFCSIGKQGPFYANLGGKTLFQTHRFEAAGTGSRDSDAALVKAAADSGAVLSPISPHPNTLHDIIAYDAKGFGVVRDRMLAVWLAMNPGIVSRCPDTGAVNGYGCVRPADVGYRVGPLFADTPEVARHVLQALLRAVPAGCRVFVDTPDMNRPFAEAMGLQRLSGWDRMFFGDPSPILPVRAIVYCFTLLVGTTRLAEGSL
jgi:hypothetical protein